MAEITSLHAAIGSLLHDGDTVAMEGFTHLIPFAAGHEAIRQGRKNLTLIRMTPDVIYDQMIGAGCAKKLIFSWGGNPGVGSLHRLRDAVVEQVCWVRGLERPVLCRFTSPAMLLTNTSQNRWKRSSKGTAPFRMP